MSEKISDAHKATIKRHLEESLAVGVPLSQIHQELMQIFSVKGKYSREQITAQTSWLRSDVNLKRVNELNWDEGLDDSNEDANFDNPEKNTARNWHVRQLLEHTTADTRKDMKYLLLPGKNDFDLKAFTDAGIEGRNLVTYILGEHPKAIAQYVRNCRNYGVRNRRIGEMSELFENEPSDLQGAYIDYFGQFCTASVIDAHLFPIHPHSFPICISLNFKKGREHQSTKGIANQNRNMNEFVNSNKHRVQTISDLVDLFFEGKDREPDNFYEMSDLRDDIIRDQMFACMGVARQEHWIARDLVKASTKKEQGNEDLENLEPLQQYARVMHHMRNLVSALTHLDRFRDSLGYTVSLAEVMMAAGKAVVNSPVIRHLAEPISYISGESHKPFRSYFAVLETRKDVYEKWVRAIEFVFNLGRALMEKCLAAGFGSTVNIRETVTVVGSGEKKKIIARGPSGTLDEIKHDFLIESLPELGASGCSARYSERDCYDRLRRQDLELVAAKKQQDRVQDLKYKIGKSLFDHFMRPQQKEDKNRIGRNDLCPCGSGKKFKRCCMKGNSGR